METKEVIETYLFNRDNIHNVTKTDKAVEVFTINEFPKKGVMVWFTPKQYKWYDFKELTEEGYDYKKYGTLTEFVCLKNNYKFNYKNRKILSWDIETKATDKYIFDSPEKAENGIFIISVSCKDQSGKITNHQFHGVDEKTIIKDFIDLWKEFNPDIILTYNGNDYDFPYLIKRCETLKIGLPLSRNGKEPYVNQRAGTNLKGERKKYRNFSQRCGQHDHNLVKINGRLNIDLMICAEQNTILSNESKSLKNVCVFFGVDKDWKDFEVGEIFNLYQDPKTRQQVLDYAQKDSLNTLKLFDILGTPELLLSELYGLDFNVTFPKGAITHNNFIFKKLYSLLGKELKEPRMMEIPETIGGLSKVIHTGIIKTPVYHGDFASMYPNIISKFNITSKNDTEFVVPTYLGILFKYRLQHKQNKNLYQTIKILINSVFGCFKDKWGRSIINDYNASERTTTTGRILLSKFLTEIIKLGYTPIEIDTDGIYFTNGRNEVDVKVLESLSLKDFMNYEVKKFSDIFISYGGKNYGWQ